MPFEQARNEVIEFAPDNHSEYRFQRTTYVAHLLYVAHVLVYLDTLSVIIHP